MGGEVGRWRLAALGLILAVAVTGCGGQREVRGDHHTIYVHGGSVLPRGGEDALIEGSLTTRDACVLIEHPDMGTSFPVIWPSGTSIASDDPLTLRLPSGEVLAVGQIVSGGGGYHYVASDRVTVAIPPECVPESGEVAVFNPDAALSVIVP